MADVRIISNRDEVLRRTKDGIMAGLEAVGLEAEGDAKFLCAVETGLLKNSITHGTSGEPINHSYSDDAGEQSGNISTVIGTADDKEVYIGTNVEYAPYVEYGTSRMKAQPFLRRALEENKETYAKIIAKALKGVE